MGTRTDSASRLIHASASTIYRAFARAEAMNTWLPPQGMTGSMLAFDFREGGGYRMRLVYDGAGHLRGKTSQDADEVEVRFTRLAADRRIEQTVAFDSQDAAFSGEMKITWTLEPMAGGTLVTVQCENVPGGIRAEDHEAALTSTLENLEAFASGDT